MVLTLRFTDYCPWDLKEVINLLWASVFLTINWGMIIVLTSKAHSKYSIFLVNLPFPLNPPPNLSASLLRGRQGEGQMITKAKKMRFGTYDHQCSPITWPQSLLPPSSPKDIGQKSTQNWLALPMPFVFLGRQPAKPLNAKFKKTDKSANPNCLTLEAKRQTDRKQM